MAFRMTFMEESFVDSWVSMYAVLGKVRSGRHNDLFGVTREYCHASRLSSHVSKQEL